MSELFIITGSNGAWWITHLPKTPTSHTKAISGSKPLGKYRVGSSLQGTRFICLFNLNPNLVLIGAVIVILTVIVVYSGRHTKITISKGVSIEANIPSNNQDTVNSKRRSH